MGSSRAPGAFDGPRRGPLYPSPVPVTGRRAEPEIVPHDVRHPWTSHTGRHSGDYVMGHGVPELVLELNGRTWTLDPSRSYNVGRDPQGDMVLDDARVSWRHATVRWAGRSWIIEDQGSTNGTYVQGQRIHQVEIGPGSTVHLGNATDGPRVTLSAGAPAADAFSAQPAMAPQQQAAQGWQAPPRSSRRPSSSRPPSRAGRPRRRTGSRRTSRRSRPSSRSRPGRPSSVPRSRRPVRRSTATAARPPSTAWTPAG